MGMEPVNKRIDIEDYVEPPRKVTTYDFQLDQPGPRGGLQLHVWEHMKDTVKLMPWGWVFTFPRVKQSISVYRAHVVTLTCEEAMKVYVDAMEVQKALVADAKAKMEEKAAKKHGENKTTA